MRFVVTTRSWGFLKRKIFILYVKNKWNENQAKTDKLFVFLTDIASNEYHIWHEKIHWELNFLTEIVDDSCFMEVKAIAGKWYVKSRKYAFLLILKTTLSSNCSTFSTFFLTFFRTSNKDVIIVSRPRDHQMSKQDSLT